MTTITQTNPSTATGANTPTATTNLGSVSQKEFLTLLTTELQQQDPTEPVDQKDMIAQMAQISSLQAATQGNSTLSDISSKLDTLIAATKANGATTGV